MKYAKTSTTIIKISKKLLNFKNGNFQDFIVSDQLIKQKHQRLMQMKRTQRDYADRIMAKDMQVQENKVTINNLEQKEKIALYTLKNTLNQENMFDFQRSYDIRG